jgi:TP53 regulating kinase and related kinases
MKEKMIAQGAEAILTHIEDSVLKQRIAKNYRHRDLDQRIRKQRTRIEGRILERVGKVIPTPKVLSVNERTSEIKMEYLDGLKLSDHLDEFDNRKAMKICRRIGENVAKMHDAGVIHGDLTTSNMIYSEKGDRLYFIDFGLGFHSIRIEDKAVDLHLLKQAFESKHFKKWEIYFGQIINSYKKNSPNSEKVLNQLKKVEARGRYKGKH